MNISKAIYKFMVVAMCFLTQNVWGADDWELLISLEGRWKFSIGDEPRWSDPDYNDNKWATIPVPSTWENEGFHGYNGFAWYRKIFNGNYLPKNKAIFLFLGYIDDVDEVYINGHLIGASGSLPPKFYTAYNARRRYMIPSSVINFDGNNLISVRVYDKYGEGGIIHGDIGLYTTEGVPNLTVGLEGIWQFKQGDEPQWKNRYYNDEGWDHITVPSPWENQGFKRYNGYGWYRRTIRFTEEQVREPLVLLLGKIDDFDQTYFNGKLIGSTNDGRSYGHSRSFSKIRVYEIPQDFIRVGQTNTIAVRVHDIGKCRRYL